ncbi:MAG: GntR family transcriptional regulator [Arenicellales bacterium]
MDQTRKKRSPATRRHPLNRASGGARRTAAPRESSTARYQRIYKTVRERISLLEHPPGTALSETKIAAEFGVSRTPVRRVLQRLDFEGLVSIKNGVGTIVTDIDLRTFREIYNLRMRLAELMGDLSPRPASRENIRRVELLLKRARKLKAGRDVKEYARICNEFGDCLLELIGSSPLREITEVLYYRVARIWLTFLPDMDWAAVCGALEVEIRDILEAMRRGDIGAVGRIRREHFYGLLLRLGEFISR